MPRQTSTQTFNLSFCVNLSNEFQLDMESLCQIDIRGSRSEDACLSAI